MSPDSERGVALLVEDQADVRDICRALLAHCGFDVRVAADAEEATRLYDDLPEPPGLLITDVVMPGMNGVALASALRARHPCLRVIFISGHAAGAMDHDKAQVLGAAFLPKPFTLEDLAAVLQVDQQAPGLSS